MVRLVKGAYWDTEIKRGQERGVDDYPVFTRKSGTDVSFMACAKAMLGEARLFPAFATHNALTVATVLEWAGDRGDLEFQRLHGMGEGLYEDLMASRGLAVRIYAPVRRLPRPAGLSRPPPAGERRQHQLRSPDRRPRPAGRGSAGRPRRCR